MDEIFAETSKETVKELSLLSLTGTSKDSPQVTGDGSYSASVCSSDMDFFDSWHDDDSASDIVLEEHGADFSQDVYRIVENETQIISGPTAWPPPTFQPLHTKRKGRLSRFLAKFKVRRQRERNKFGRFKEKGVKESEYSCMSPDRVFNPEQAGICDAKQRVSRAPCEDVIIPVFHSNSLDCPQIIRESLTATGLSKNILCQGPCHVTGVAANHCGGRWCHVTASELPTTVESVVKDKAVKRAESLDIKSNRPDGIHNHKQQFQSRVRGLFKQL